MYQQTSSVTTKTGGSWCGSAGGHSWSPGRRRAAIGKGLWNWSEVGLGLCGCLLLGFAGLFLQTGCNSLDSGEPYGTSYESWFSEDGGRLPVEAGGSLFFMDREAGELVVIGNQDVGDVSVERIPVCPNPGRMLPMPDGRVGIICAESRRFVAVKPGESGCKKAEWHLAAPFDGLSFSADGKAAVAYFTSSGGDGAGLGNPHQLALIDLDGGVEGEFDARWVSLPSHGALPERVDIGPRVTESGRRLVIVGSNSYVLVLDYYEPDEVVYVPLTVGAMEGARVQKALFLDDGVTTVLLVRGVEDVFLLTVPDGDSGGLQPSINPAPVGKDPADVVHYLGGDGKDKLLVLNHGSSSLTVIDLASLQTKDINLSSAANRIAVTDHPDGGAKKLAILYKVGSRIVQLVDLPDVETSWVRAVDEKILNVALKSLWVDGEQGVAVMVHDGVSNLPLTVLDLENRTLAPFSGGGGVFSSTMDQSGHKLFVVLASNPPMLTWIDMVTLLPENLKLADEGKIFLMPGSGKLAVVHQSGTGFVSFYDLADPAGKKATHVQGFLLAEGVQK